MIKTYTMIVLDLLLFLLPWLEEFNQLIKAISLIGGLVLLYYTIKKIRMDLRIKSLQEKQEEEKLKILQDED